MEMTNKEYHASKELSRSQLSDLLYSPKLFYLKHIKKELREPSQEAFDFGNLVHTLALEPHKLEKEFHVADCAIRRGKVYEAAVGEAKDKIVITTGELEKAKTMIKNLPLDFKNAQVEKSFVFNYKDIGFKCRPDAIMEDGNIVDLKTSASAFHNKFLHSVHEYDYDLQAYMICKGLILNDLKPCKFKWLVIEKSDPYPMAIYEAGDTVLQLGRIKFEKAVKVYKECLEKNYWPDFLENNTTIEIPTYIFNKYAKEF